MSTVADSDKSGDDGLQMIEDSGNVQVFEFSEPLEIEYQKTPKSISREDLFPASYLFKPRDTTFKDALDKEVEARLEQTQFRENLATFGLKPLIGDQDREAFVDDQGVLSTTIETNEIPFLPRLMPLGPKKSLVMMTGYQLPGESLANANSISPTPEPKPASTRKRGRAPVKAKRVLEKFASSPFLKLRQYQNRFLYAKAMLHPYLETYKFHDVARILSALWNDYRRSRASDYFTYLTLCTNIEAEAIKQVRSFVNVVDFPDTKTAERNCEEEIEAIFENHRKEVEEFAELERQAHQKTATNASIDESADYTTDFSNQSATNETCIDWGSETPTALGADNALLDAALIDDAIHSGFADVAHLMDPDFENPVNLASNLF